MIIPIEIICIFLGAMLGLQGWILARIFSLERRVACLTLRMNLHLHPEPKTGDTDQLRRWASKQAG